MLNLIKQEEEVVVEMTVEELDLVGGGQNYFSIGAGY